MTEKLVKIGSTGINMAAVVRWDLYREEVRAGDGIARPASPTGQYIDKVRLRLGNGEYEWFEGEEATALKAWLEANAEDLMAPPTESPGAHL